MWKIIPHFNENSLLRSPFNCNLIPFATDPSLDYYLNNIVQNDEIGWHLFFTKLFLIFLFLQTSKWTSQDHHHLVSLPHHHMLTQIHHIVSEWFILFLELGSLFYLYEIIMYNVCKIPIGTKYMSVLSLYQNENSICRRVYVYFAFCVLTAIFGSNALINFFNVIGTITCKPFF